MTSTKKPHFSFQDSLKFGNGESIFDKSRYSNFLLKRNHSLISNEAVRSNSLNESRKSPSFIDYTYDNEQRIDMMKWRQRESRSRTSDLMEIDNNLEKTDKKLGDKISSPNSKSSLSLHISAYENSFDTVKANERKDELKEAESKNDSFKIPRQQQQNQNNRVETMEFRLSTKLLNPHPLVTAPESDSDEGEIDDEKEYAEIKAKSLQSLVVVIPDSKAKPSKIKKNLNELKTKISTEKSLIKKNLVTLDKDILSSIGIEKRIMDEICERIRGQRIVSNRLIDDLRHYQKQTLNAIKTHSDALKNYQKLENEEDEIHLNLMEKK